VRIDYLLVDLLYSYECPSFGNFINRVLKFISSQYDSVVPDSGDVPGPYSLNDPADSTFFAEINSLIKDYTDAMEAVKLRLGLQTVMLISNRSNSYLQSSGLNKSLMASDPTRCAQVVSRAINVIYVLSALVYPFMPATSESILTQLNAPARSVPEVLSADILAGHHISKPEHLFKKIEEKMADTWRAKYGGPESNPSAPLAETADIKQGMSKRKAAAAQTAVKSNAIPNAGPKSAEVLALEAEIAKQGQTIRLLKAQNPRTAEVSDQIADMVTVLKRLKGELALLEKS
jgi:methionyl-tRNA synthetase